MFFYEFKVERREDLSQGLVNDHDKLLMIDTYCKFLFPFSFAMFFSNLVRTLMLNLENIKGHNLLYILIAFYVSIGIPSLTVLDMYTTERTRNPSPGKDIILLLFINLFLFGYKVFVYILTNNNLNIILPELASCLVLGLVVVNGYILYDYIIHRKTGGTYYIMFRRVEDLNPDHRQNQGERNNL